MSNLTYTPDELRELSSEALENGDFDTARSLAENAQETEEEQREEQAS